MKIKKNLGCFLMIAHLLFSGSSWSEISLHTVQKDPSVGIGVATIRGLDGLVKDFQVSLDPQSHGLIFAKEISRNSSSPRVSRSHTWYQWTSSLKSEIFPLIVRARYEDYRTVAIHEGQNLVAVTLRSVPEARERLFVVDRQLNKVVLQHNFEEYLIADVCWRDLSELLVLLEQNRVRTAGLGIFSAIAGHPVPLSSFFVVDVGLTGKSSRIEKLPTDEIRYGAGQIFCESAPALR